MLGAAEMCVRGVCVAACLVDGAHVSDSGMCVCALGCLIAIMTLCVSMSAAAPTEDASMVFICLGMRV